MTGNKEKPRGLLPGEMKVHGLQACLQLFARRPTDIVRLYLTKGRAKQFPDLVKWAVENRRAYHVLEEKEMDAVCGSLHHEGLGLVAKGLPPVPWKAFLDWAKGPGGPVVLLDGVQNPQNVGAILRASAHFGVAYLLGDGESVRLTPSGMRVAEGAAEWVRPVVLENPVEALKELKGLGFVSVATSSHKGQSLYHYRFPPKTVFILGSEAKGVSKDLFTAADQVVTIPGTGVVESLNVSAATALLLGEHWRQHRRR